MDTIIIKILGLAVAGLLVGCGGSKDVAPPFPASGVIVAQKVECVLEPSKSQYMVGEPILMSVTVRNLSNAPVNVAFMGQQKEQPIVNFRIRGPSPKTMLVSTKQNLWCGTGVGNVSVPANSEYKISVDLLKTWEWGGTKTKIPLGSYSISAELFSTTTDGGSFKVAESGYVSFAVVAGE